MEIGREISEQSMLNTAGIYEIEIESGKLGTGFEIRKIQNPMNRLYLAMNRFKIVWTRQEKKKVVEPKKIAKASGTIWAHELRRRVGCGWQRRLVRQRLGLVRVDLVSSGWITRAVSGSTCGGSFRWIWRWLNHLGRDSYDVFGSNFDFGFNSVYGLLSDWGSGLNGRKWEEEKYSDHKGFDKCETWVMISMMWSETMRWGFDIWRWF